VGATLPESAYAIGEGVVPFADSTAHPGQMQIHAVLRLAAELDVVRLLLLQQRQQFGR